MPGPPEAARGLVGVACLAAADSTQPVRLGLLHVPLLFLASAYTGCPNPLTVSTLNHRASSFVSSHTEDVYRLRSTYPDRDFTPLFAVAFSHGAKRIGGRQIAAVSSEEGVVDFLDVKQGASWDREHDRKRWQPHQNAIFDVCWSNDDTQIVRCSAPLAVMADHGKNCR